MGKSSLKHLLVHNTPKAVTTSAAVMDTPEVVRSERYTVGESTSAWQLADSDIMRKSLHACIANEAYEEKDQYPTEMGTEEADDGQHEASVERQKDTLLTLPTTFCFIQSTERPLIYCSLLWMCHKSYHL